MAGVGNDVTHLGTAPHWKYDLTAPLSEPACIEKTSFMRNTNYSFRSMLTRIVAVQTANACVESKNRRLSNNKIILNLKCFIDQSFQRISRCAKVNAVVKKPEKILVTQSSS